MTIACAIALVALQDDPYKPLLAVTPVMDGTLFDEEWLSTPTQGNAKGYFQWEPGTVYVAGSANLGEEIVVSIDQNGDGWLVGNDNIEFRVTYHEGKGSVSARTLDATLLDGPAWASRPASDFAPRFGTQGDRWIIEAALSAEGWSSVEAGRQIGIGIESVQKGITAPAPYMPRKLSFYRMAMEASDGLPADIELKTSTKLREVAKDDSLSMVFELSGGGFFATSETRGEGFARSALSVKTRAYPATDEKKRMRIDYDSVVDSGAMTGWRVLRSTLVDAKGNKALLRTSFKVTELVTFDVALPESLAFSEIDQSLSGSISVRSMGVGKIEGEFFANVPEGWRIDKGGPQRLMIYNPRGREKVNLRFVVPGKASGPQQVTFTVVVGEQVYTKSVTIEIK